MEATFDEFVSTRLSPVLRFAGVLTGDRHLAEEIVQEVLLKVHQRWATIARLDVPEAYVRRMIVNEYISWRRKWARIIPSGQLADGPRLPSVSDHADRLADRADLADRLRTLPPRQRAVIVLRYFEDLSDADIAEQLRCSVGTVRGYASRALATLRVADAPEVSGAAGPAREQRKA